MRLVLFLHYQNNEKALPKEINGMRSVHDWSFGYVYGII